MKRFLKSLSLLLCSSFLVATGWTAGESISIGLGNNQHNNNAYAGADLYGWEGAQVAGNNWNNSANGAAINGLKMNTGITVSGAKFTLSSNSDPWRHDAPTQLGGGLRCYFDGPKTITLEGIPFAEYKVVIFMAADAERPNGWLPIKVTSGGGSTFYTYENGELAEKTDFSQGWGSTKLVSGYTAEEGVNVMIIPGLSGNVTMAVGGESGSTTSKDAFYAIQVINTGKTYTVTDEGGSWDINPVENDSVAVDFGATSEESAYLTVDGDLTFTSMLTMGEHGGTLAKSDESKQWKANKTFINTDTTVEAGSASLGSVTIADGKTLTVGNGYFSSPTTINDMPISGTGTLALDLGAENTLQLSGENSNKPFGLKVLSGTLKFHQSCPNNGHGPGYGRTIIVSGAKSVLATGTNTDATGWNVTSNQSLQLLDGAKMLVYKRDTFKTPLTMRDATIELQSGAADGYRGLDWFDQTTELKVLAHADASPTSPTISKITYNAAIGQGDARKFRIRQQDVNGSGFFVNVAENAQLMIDMVIDHSGTTSFKKRGVGELVLTAANTFTCPLTVEAGTLHLTTNASIPQDASVTINDGATLAGTGTISGALTFNAGATIDVTDGAITANGTVTLPAEGTVTVTGVFGGNYILKTTSASDDGVAKFTVAEGYEVVADNVGYKVIKVVTLEDGTTYDVKAPLEYTKIITEGAITINIADITLDQAMVEPYLDVTGVTGGVTYTTAYETFSSYTVGRIDYSCVFLGTEDDYWNTTANWYGSYRQLGDEKYWLSWTPKTATKVPGAQDSNEWSALLVDGSLIGDRIDKVNNYKTVTMTEANALEGWALKLRVSNEVHLIIANLRKLQSAQSNNSEGMIYVDETSKLTIQAIGTQGNNVYGGAFTILGKLDVTGNLTVAGSNPGYNYTLGKNGHVQYAGLSGARTHKVASVILNLGDSALTGKGIVERELVGFTSADANQTFTYEESGVSGVTNADESGTVTVTKKNSVAELSEIGDYCFVKRDNDGYYVVYMAYAETVELTEFTATVDANGTTLSEALNGAVLSASAALTIDFGGTSGQTFIFDNEEALNFSSITVTGTNGGTIALDQNCADIACEALTLNTVVSADAAFYAVNTGTIDGTGKLCLASGELTLAKANTYMGGTDIATDATLTMSNANSIGTGNITGAGTLVCNGVIPANKNGLTTGTPAEGETPASGWLGTLTLNGAIELNDTAKSLEALGNANSHLIIGGTLTGYLSQPNDTTICSVPVELNGSLTLTNGYDNKVYQINKLSGSGLLHHNKDLNYVINIIDGTAFKGSLKTTQNAAKIYLGEYDSSKTEAGKIVVATDATIATGATWSGQKGLTILENTTLTVDGAINCDITNNGTLVISAATALPTDKTVSGAGTLVVNGNIDLSSITGELTCALQIKAGVTVVVTSQQISNFEKLIFEEGAELRFAENIRDDGEISLPTIEGIPTIKVIRADGETTEVVEIEDGKASFTPLYSGKICWHDYEFNKSLNDAGYGDKTLSRDSGRPSWSTGNQNTTNESEIATDYKDLGNGNYALFAATHPYTDFTYPEEWTAVIVATLPEEEDEILLAFGTLDGGTISLIKGKNADEVKLVRTTGNSKYEALATMTVPNATTAAHLYAFTKTARQIKIYLDGSLWLTYVAQSDITFGAGFQIASVHGGLGSTGMKRPVEDDKGVSYIDALRMYEVVLSQKAITALANEFPYNSPKGTYMRTVNGEVNWVEEGAWTKVGDNENTYASPAPGSTVILTAEDDATVVVNLDGNVPYEAITVNGDATVRFNKGTGKTGVIQNSGKTQIDTNVTITAGAIDIHGGPIFVSEGKTLTFDYTECDFSKHCQSEEIMLTGIATLGDTAQVLLTPPTEYPAYLTAELKQNQGGNYVLAITVRGTLAATIESNAITWKIGDVEIDMPADFTAWETIPMTVVGANILTLAADITMPSVTLTRSGEGVAAVTFENGKLTVTNTLTMNNVNVMATPDTLAAAVVMGTAGTESFTMYSRASYSHENKFAMRFENCAFTKDGEGTFPIASSGFVLDRVNVTLANGALQLVIGSGDPQIKDTTFTYVDANKDGVADGELTNHGWMHSTTTTTFVVPEGVTGKALVGSCLSNTGAVVKQGAGTLELGVMKTANAGPYTGATTIEAGTLVYDVTNNTANPFVMSSVITVEAGAAIKGVENCTLASLTFEAGAIIDATDAPVVATDVTLPETGTVKVRMTSHGEVLKAMGLDDVTKFAVEGEGRANWSLVMKENGLVYVAAPDTGDVEFSAEVQKMLNAMAQAAAGREGITSLTIEGVTLAMDGEGNPVKADIAGLELFESVPVLVVPDGENGTGVAMVNYVFGISDITVNGDGYIVVKASVDRLAMDNPVEPIEGEDAGEGEGEMPELPRPTFVNGVVVELLNKGNNGETVIGTETVDLVNMDNASEITIRSGNTVAEILNGTGTLDLTVKATNQTSGTPDAGEGDEDEVTSAE